MFLKRQLEILFVSVALMLFANRAWSDESVGLGWDPSPDTNVVGYLVYYGNASGDYTSRIDVDTNTLVTITQLQPGLTYYFTVSAHDASGNESVLSNEASFTVPSGDPPILASIANQTISFSQKLIISNSVTDTNAFAGDLTYSLEAGAPDGMSINPTNGILYWSPTFAETGTTNQITVLVSDSSVPPLTATQTFIVMVPDMAELSITSAVVSAGQTVAVPITLDATGPVTNLSFVLDIPADRVTSVTVQSLLPQTLTITQQPAGAAHSVITVQTINGQSLLGVQNIAQLYLSAAAQQPSSFGTISISSLNAAMADGQSVDETNAVNSKLVIVSSDSLMEAGLVNGNRNLTLYGQPGNSYEIQSTTNLTPPCVWTPEFTTVLTNLAQVLPGIANDNSTKFYRARNL